MSLALEQAQLALKAGEVPVGCVFVNEETGEVEAASHNLTNETKNATTHCEINCIRQFDGKPMDHLTLYVTCEPCIMCAHALNIVGIKKVVFGCHNDKFGGNGSILTLQTYEIVPGVLKDEAIKVLQ